MKGRSRQQATSLNSGRRLINRASVLIALLIALTAISVRMRADTGTCNGGTITLPFTDVPASNAFFCAIAQAYFSGLSNGTTATTYSPTNTVTREQMAAFITRTQDSVLKRGSRRAALNQWWTQAGIPSSATTQVGDGPQLLQSDGKDIWVANFESATVSRVRGSDGKLLGTWTGATNAVGVLVARGRIFVLGGLPPGQLYSLNPTQAPGPVTLVTDELGPVPKGIAYDGARIWTANTGSGIPGGLGNVSIVRFGVACFPAGCVTTVSTGFNGPTGILYDGSHIWVTDYFDNRLKKLNSDGSIAQSIVVGTSPVHPVFDGTNIWVPNSVSDSVTVVRVKDSAGNPLPSAFVLATLTGNGLSSPHTAAFDGQRILVTNPSDDSVSLWKATDLTPLGSFSTGADTLPFGACSDGINFWVTLFEPNKLARF
jgi:hypothetical protein